MSSRRRIDRVDAMAARPPLAYDATAFPNFAVTVDVVILTIFGNELCVLLVRRSAAPFAGHWALPGGFKQPNETLDQAAARELLEETGIAAPAHLAQFKAYGDPGRDTRTNVVSVAYLAVVPSVDTITAGSDAAAARLWPVAKALSRTTKLAFDHRKIISDAVDRARTDLERSNLATAFIGPTFTLSQLRSVYETVWDAELDPANFRRGLTANDEPFVEPTNASTSPGPGGGRPATLFRPAAGWKNGSPVKRPRQP